MATPDLLMERLQRAVAPDYRVERKLGGGGMGVVYLAHEAVLNRDVAIKVLRPELYTATAAESFLREAQILAGISHPNVIVIFRAASKGGLQFYIMELIKGPTLEDRLAAGPMPVADAVGLGIDLLRGLEAVHRLGVVHRDVKPSNVFVLSDGAKLGDFGIARPSSADDGDPHNRDGTADYMAHEQVQGKSVTPRSDIYSTGVVLYEAVTGRSFHEQGKQVDWSRVPNKLARVLQRAVEAKPEDRWRDAAAFRKALERAREPGKIPWIAGIPAGLVVVAAGIVYWFGSRPPPSKPGALDVGFDKIEYVGPADNRFMADSLLHWVRADLDGHPDFHLAPLPGFLLRRPASLVIQARIAVTDGGVRLQLMGGIPAAEFHVAPERWPIFRDSITYRILLGIWSERSPLAPSLPVRALPRSSAGLLQFLEAELLVAEAQWGNAHDAYLKAEATDSTCLICSWRITEIERWLSREPDPARVARYRDHIDAFPTWYQSLIRAAQLPLRLRLDTLRAVTENQRDFFLGWFQLGDELLHRGPLAGHGRAEAIPALETTLREEPGFGPASEHLAWVATAEGDSSAAASALASLSNHGVAPDPYTVVLRELLGLGFAWRFLPEQEALVRTREVLGRPASQSSADLGAGPRLLPTFDVPRGAVALGRMLAASDSRALRRSGLIAQTLSSVALGQLADARESALRLTAVSPESEMQLFTAELEGALALLDEGSGAKSHALEGLRPWISSHDVQPQLHDRAIWMSNLLGRRMPLRANAPRELALLITADSLAGAGRPRVALGLLDALDVDSVTRAYDPFYRTVVHVRRAAWRAQVGDTEGARGELLWHEHLDVVGLPTGLPQAAEVDWAFGTLARWRLARLLDGAGRAVRGEACGAYGAVIRHWSQAPAPYGARADTARVRARALNCATR